MTISLFEECISDIDFAYKDLGHKLGWRFLSVSKSIFDAPIKLVVVTINPAGNEIPKGHPWESCESGVSYVVEKWGTSLPGEETLQIQVQHLFKELCTSLNFKGSNINLMAQSLIAHFIPFRSPRFKSLHNKEQSIKFGLRLWGKILPAVKPKLIICLGREVQKQMRTLIDSQLSGKCSKKVPFQTGWGKYEAELEIYKISNGEIRLLYLPHLSTWTLFTSKKSAPNMPGIIKAATKGL